MINFGKHLRELISHGQPVMLSGESALEIAKELEELEADKQILDWLETHSLCWDGWKPESRLTRSMIRAAMSVKQ